MHKMYERKRVIEIRKIVFTVKCWKK